MPDPTRYQEFIELVGLHTNRMLAYIDALLLDWNDAEDIFQETCLLLWERFDDFKPGTNFLAWALRFADHQVLKHRTKQSRRMAFAADLRDVMMAELAQKTSEEDAAANLTVLAGCVDKLPENDRKMVMLCYAEEVPVSRVAGVFGRSPQSVHNSLCRIRKWLLECARRGLRAADAPSTGELRGEKP